MTLTNKDKQQLFSKISNLVQNKFYDPEFNGRSWRQLVLQYRKQIEQAGTPEEFEGGVNSLLGELHSSGLGLLSRHTKISSRSSIAASFCKVYQAGEGERWAFQDVQAGGVADKAGVKPADLLRSIDGKEITPPQQPLFEMNETKTIVVSRNGTHRMLKLEVRTPRYRDNPYSEPTSIVESMLPEATANLKVTLFPGKLGIDFANRLDELFSGKLKNSERLVVDLRGNPGGGVGGIRLMSYFTPNRQPIGYSFDRKCFEEKCNPQKLPRFGRIPKSKWEVALLALRYGGRRSIVIETEGRGVQSFHGRIVVLINEHTSGAAEMVAQFAKENSLAKLVGTRTSGRLAARSAFVIGHGYRLTIPVAAYVSWKGIRIEGTGIEPDVAVDWSFQDAVEGRDVQFQRALSVVKAL